MHYYESEIIMSLDNALALKANELLVLEHVRTYEYTDDELLGHFIEIKCIFPDYVVRKNRIVDYPQFQVDQEQQFSTIEDAIATFRIWINEIKS